MKGKNMRRLPIILAVMLLLLHANLLGALPTASAPEPPIPNFIFTPIIPYVNEIVRFDASRSKSGGGDITAYNWDFGDSTTGAGIFINKSYSKSKNYTVTLTVINSAGLSNSTSKTISVLPEPGLLSLDLYDQKGGRGRAQPGGQFAPGEVVILRALLTYDNESVEYKPVVFEVRDALGDAVLYRTAFTNASGIAEINFTISAECLPRIFGTWGALAVSSVSEQEASDTITFKVSGPYLDIYTQKPEPYSGKGHNKPSDAFAPQQEVILYGDAHFDCEPIEFKFVAFEIKDPSGSTIDSRVNATDENGIAMVSFRLASNATFGIYTVFGNVEILGMNASDVLTFRVGWLVELLTVTTANVTGGAKSIFEKGDNVCFNITAKNIAFTSKVATFTLVVYDFLKVPIGNIVLGDWIVPPGPSVVFLISVQIPDWAFTGVAQAYASALTDLPALGGLPYCPEISTMFTIVP
jgi:PKD repeat protein